MSVRLSVAIPFHRRRDYLEIAVASALAQDEVSELVVVDDGGIETGVETWIEGLGDTRVAYHRNPENFGMVPTWNICFERTGGELVTLLHADDQLLPSYASLMLELAAAYPRAAAFCCDATIIDAEGKSVFSLADAVKPLFRGRGRDPLVVAGEAGLRSLMAGNFIMCPTLCYRRATLGARRFEPEWRQVQDLALTSRIVLDGDAIVCSRQRAYAYRRHPEGATAVQSESRLRFDEEFALFERVASRADEHGWHTAARVSRGKRIVKLHLLYRTLRELLHLRFRNACDWLRYLLERR
ncbi:MAG: glycosyltransferase family 2 protein [Deltaproteobacteria bacterium]|nr:glycosyltransferase family 2 protein [Deltaproteobacteria bacterium]MBW2360933.1 glycosyltransferase family 2 protein [Deltaproteobacteria bacterium]